jgi:hypothetical protein
MYAGGDTEPDCSSASRYGTTTIIVLGGCYRISARLGLGPATVIDGAGPGAASCAGGGTVIVQTSPTGC